MRNAGIALALAVIAATAAPQETPAARQALIARARSLELDTPYVPPPGNPLEHHAAGFAKVVCSGVFISGFEPGFVAENTGYFTAPPAERAKLGQPVVDRDKKEVRVTVPGGATRVARYLGSQGCVALPPGADAPSFTPVRVESRLPDPSTQAWPLGDVLPKGPLPAEVDAGRLERALRAAFEPPSALTAAVVVTWKGRLLGERYGAGATMRTPLESWSMGKSLTATLMGILIREGAYALAQPAPVPEWQSPGDPRAKIRIADLLNMSSGLRIRAPLDPDFEPSALYADHLYLYTGPVNLFHYAATRAVQWPPGTVGRYRNTDPVLVNYLVRLAVEKRGGDYLSFPQRALFDRIGIRSAVLETDAFGNFLIQGYEFLSARDWARLGNLYLAGGLAGGERLLPAEFITFVRTPAPGWKADRRPVYGGFFWLNTDGALSVPRDAYYMNGAGGQFTVIVPSHDLVVVRIGHDKGGEEGTAAFNRALALLVQTVPAARRPR